MNEDNNYGRRRKHSAKWGWHGWWRRLLRGRLPTTEVPEESRCTNMYSDYQSQQLSRPDDLPLCHHWLELRSCRSTSSHLQDTFTIRQDFVHTPVASQNRSTFGEPTAPNRCQTLYSSKVNWKKINRWKLWGHAPNQPLRPTRPSTLSGTAKVRWRSVAVE